ncbi:MAG: hypothetical protein ACE5GK_02170 [Nitrospiria bacterium]
MKQRIILVAVFVLLGTNETFARGFINNPDRFPSIGLSFGLISIDGDLSYFNNGALLTPKSSAKTESMDLTLDLRVPVSHSLTFFGAFSIQSDEATSNETTAFFGTDRDLFGYGLRLGARYYFNK